MKKTRLIALMMVLAVAVSLISSCSIFGGKEDVAKLINEEAEFETEKVYTTASLLSIPDGYLKDSVAGDLILFVDNDFVEGAKYVVYNVVSGQNVRTFENTDDDVEMSVQIGTIGDDDNYAEYIMVNKTTVRSDKTTYFTELYDETGLSLHSMSKNTYNSAQLADDIVTLDGKAFKVSGGKLVNAFDYSGMGNDPVIDSKVGEYYYGSENNIYYIYDTNLVLVAKYELPAYAQNGTSVVLANGNLLVQYYWQADAMSEKYDLLMYGEKYDYETVMIKLKDGSAKSIKCEYILEGVYNDAAVLEENGLDEVMAVYGYAIKIEDKLPSQEVGVYITEKGKVEELGTFNGAKITDVKMVAANRWVVDTNDGASYLIDAEGTLIGDISNVSIADIYADYIIYAGKIYDYNLKLMYDYSAVGLEIASSSGNYIVFRDDNGGYRLYTGGSNTQIISNDSDDVYVSFEDDYFVVRTGEYGDYSVIVYNAEGDSMLTKSSNGALGVSKVYSSDDNCTIIIRVVDSYDSNYYAIK